MSIDHYYKKQQGTFVGLEDHEVEAKQTEYAVTVKNNIADVGFFFQTVEEATAFYEKEEREKASGSRLGLFDPGKPIRSTEENTNAKS